MSSPVFIYFEFWRKIDITRFMGSEHETSIPYSTSLIEFKFIQEGPFQEQSRVCDSGYV